MRNEEGSHGSRRPDGVAVVAKAVDLLEYLADGHPRSVAQLASGAGITKAAAYRILHTLEERGWVVREDEIRRYALGPSLLAIARSRRSAEDLVPAARPFMQALWEAFGETVNLGLPTGGRILYLDVIESDQRLRMSSRSGSEDPIHSTALGKAILACLEPAEAGRMLRSVERVPRTPRTLVTLPDLLADIEATRTRGYAIDDEENETGARCVAAGVRDAAGRPIAAVSVSAPASRLGGRDLERVGEAVRDACGELGRILAGVEPRLPLTLRSP